MDDKFMSGLASYQMAGEEFDFAPSKKRAVALLGIGMILFTTFILILYTGSGLTPLRFALLKLLIPFIIGLLCIALYLMFRATNKRYWFTRDAVRIIKINPFGKGREDYLPLAEIAGIHMTGAYLSGLTTRLLTGGTVNHIIIETLDGKWYQLNDVPHGYAVTRVLLDKVSAVRGVPGPKLVGLKHHREALEDKLREEKGKKGH